MINIVNLFINQGSNYYYRTMTVICNIQKFPLNLSPYNINRLIRKNYYTVANVAF